VKLIPMLRMHGYISLLAPPNLPPPYTFMLCVMTCLPFIIKTDKVHSGTQIRIFKRQFQLIHEIHTDTSAKVHQL
jgi:hypothetical protein